MITTLRTFLFPTKCHKNGCLQSDKCIEKSLMLIYNKQEKWVYIYDSIYERNEWKMDNRPIGMFDSGVGGLTVFKEVKKQLPNEI